MMTSRSAYLQMSLTKRSSRSHETFVRVLWQRWCCRLDIYLPLFIVVETSLRSWEMWMKLVCDPGLFQTLVNEYCPS